MGHPRHSRETAPGMECSQGLSAVGCLRLTRGGRETTPRLVGTPWRFPASPGGDQLLASRATHHLRLERQAPERDIQRDAWADSSCTARFKTPLATFGIVVQRRDVDLHGA